MSKLTGLGRILGGSFGFFKGIFRLGLLTVFMTIVIVGAVYSALQASDPAVFVSELGSQFLSPVKNLGEASQQILNQEGFISDEAGGIFEKTWSFLSSTWQWLSPFYVIALWLKVLATLFTKFVLLDDSRKPVGWILSPIFFFLLSSLYLSETGQGGVSEMWGSVKLFGQSFVALLEPLVELGKKYIGN